MPSPTCTYDSSSMGELVRTGVGVETVVEAVGGLSDVLRGVGVGEVVVMVDDVLLLLLLLVVVVAVVVVLSIVVDKLIVSKATVHAATNDRTLLSDTQS